MLLYFGNIKMIRENAELTQNKLNSDLLEKPQIAQMLQQHIAQKPFTERS